MNLNQRQSKFLAAYLVSKNATQSAIEAGYSAKAAGQIGFRLLKHSQIAEAVKGMRSADNAANTALISETIKRIDRIAYTDLDPADIKPEHVIKALDMRARIDGLYQDQSSGMQAFQINIHLNEVHDDESERS